MKTDRRLYPSGILFVLAALCGCTIPHVSSAQPRDVTTCLLVRHAQLKVLPVISPFWGANSGHEVHPKKDGAVLLLRKFEDPDTGPDSGRYTKLSASFGSFSYPPADDRKLEVKNSYFVQGFVGEIHKKRFAYARSLALAIHFYKKGEQLYVDVKSRVQAKNDYDGSRPIINFDVSCKVDWKPAGALSEWEGRPGPGWDAFAPAGDIR